MTALVNNHKNAEYYALCSRIVDITQGCRFNRKTESSFQDGLEQVFLRWGMDFMREHSLNKQDRPDFFFVNGVAVECKVAGSIQSHLRQMRRYALHDTVTGIILIATRPYTVPNMLNDKPVICLNFAPKFL